MNFLGELINKKTKKIIRAIIVVYVLGAPSNYGKLQAIANKYKLLIIEDAAEALGSSYKNQKLGALGSVGILSFNGNKIVTTGGGGAVIVRDAELAQRIRHLVTTAKKPHPYEFEHDEIGYNFRLPAINAALGVAQLENFDQILKNKRHIFEKYREVFKDYEYGILFNPDVYGTSNYWLNAVILKEEFAHLKNEILEYCIAQGIFVRPMWKPLHMLKINDMADRADCSTATAMYDRIICLPSGAGLANA